MSHGNIMFKALIIIGIVSIISIYMMTYLYSIINFSLGIREQDLKSTKIDRLTLDLFFNVYKQLFLSISTSYGYID